MNTTEESDETLIGRYGRDDATAFDQLYKRHELRVWRYFERSVGNQATSDELLQEIWFTLARNIASLESSTRFKTRLFTLAYDRLIDSLRARAAQAAPAVKSGRPAAARDPDSALAAAIGELPNEQRQAFLLQVEGELSVGDIAVITDSTIDTAQSRLRSAKLKLHELLGENGNPVPSSEEQVNEVDQLYRRLSAQDPGRPGEWVRRKVQAYAAQQAAERSVRASMKAKEGSTPVAPPPNVAPVPTAPRQTASKPWLLPVIVAGAAVAALAGFLVVPRLMAPRDTTTAAPAPAAASQPETAPDQVAQESTPPPSESASSEPPAPRSQSPEPTSPASPPTASQPPVATSNAPTSTTPSPAAPSAPRSAGTSRTESPQKSRVARPSAADQESARISSPAAPVPAVQATRPTPPAEPAPTPQSAPNNTQVAAALPPPPVAIPTISPPAPAPTSAPAPVPAPAAAAPAAPNGLWRAAESGDMSGLQVALASNVDVNARDPNGRTALILAIQHNHGAAVKALLAHGANPNTPDSHGTTPLMAARIIANWGVFAALQRSGAH